MSCRQKDAHKREDQNLPRGVSQKKIEIKPDLIQLDLNHIAVANTEHRLSSKTLHFNIVFSYEITLWQIVAKE